jgi:glycosyltransferase involved in cell wall biosynthesis
MAQTVRALEVIVVVDGPDRATLSSLERIDDSRLKVRALPARRGPGGARNAGVDVARAEWIAFLDDDDRWDPRKLELQLEVARSSDHRYPVIACRLTEQGDGREAVLPRRPPRPDEPLSEYLFSRRGLFWGDTLLHTSTLVAPKALLERVPFREDLKKHEDWDWLLRATALDGVGVAFVPDPRPLATWTTGANRPRASTRPDWRFSIGWIRECRGLVTPRAYASFLLSIVSADAAREHSGRALWLLLWEARRRGKPRALDLLLYIGIWLLPQRLRRRLIGLA